MKHTVENRSAEACQIIDLSVEKKNRTLLIKKVMFFSEGIKSQIMVEYSALGVLSFER
jgi:hypothetical protein